MVHVIQSMAAEKGGPTQVVAGLAAALRQRGHDVVVAVGDDAADHAGVDVQPYTRALVRAADVVHAHGVWDWTVVSAMRDARRLGVPYLFCPHGMFHPWAMSQKPWKKRLALRLGVRRLLNHAAAAHVLNAREAEHLPAHGVRTPATVLPNGVSRDVVTAADDAARQGEARDDRTILFLGRLHHVKGLDVLADAFARVASRDAAAKLMVVGPDAGVRQDFERRVAAAGVADRVTLSGPLGGEAKWAALRRATVFCQPSRQEGFSVATLEALACRLPVVISTGCHFPEVAEAGAGVVVDLDPQAFADALCRVLEDASSRQRMGDAGRHLVEQRYTWPVIAERAEAMYAAVVQGRA